MRITFSVCGGAGWRIYPDNKVITTMNWFNVDNYRPEDSIPKNGYVFDCSLLNNC